jgi:hypothetical protein
MSTVQKVLLAAALAGSMATAGSAAGTREHAGIETSKPLSNAEIYKLYGKNSWIWKAGAGYFAVKARTFTAWSRENGAVSYGIGRWFITTPGKLCFNADWHAKNGMAAATTCFSHRKMGGLIYQKREPDGKWYIFRNAPSQTTDEFAKLRHGDYVSSRLRRIEAIVGQDK